MIRVIRASSLIAITAGIVVGCRYGRGGPEMRAAGRAGVPRTPGTVGSSDDLGMPFVYARWETLTTENGLPDDHVFYVRSAGSRVCVGTEHGLACREDGSWRTWTTKDGLPWDVISAITYVPIDDGPGGVARIHRGEKLIATRKTIGTIPHNYVLCVDFDKDDVWIGISKGLARGVGPGRWAGSRETQRRLAYGSEGVKQ